MNSKVIGEAFIFKRKNEYVSLRIKKILTASYENLERHWSSNQQKLFTSATDIIILGMSTDIHEWWKYKI